MPVISTNLAANSAVRYLNINAAKQTLSLSKLASGSRITQASDDAAGLAISTKISSDVTALHQAATNAAHGISVLQTADGGAANISDILQRMTALASQAASGTVTDNERVYIDAEFQQLIHEVDAISVGTRYNGQSLLDGSSAFAGGINVMVGSDAADTVKIAIDRINAAGLGLVSEQTSVTGVGTGSSTGPVTTTEGTGVASGAVYTGLVTPGAPEVRRVGAADGGTAASITSDTWVPIVLPSPADTISFVIEDGVGRQMTVTLNQANSGGDNSFTTTEFRNAIIAAKAAILPSYLQPDTGYSNSATWIELHSVFTGATESIGIVSVSGTGAFAAATAADINFSTTFSAGSATGGVLTGPRDLVLHAGTGIDASGGNVTFDINGVTITLTPAGAPRGIWNATAIRNRITAAGIPGITASVAGTAVLVSRDITGMNAGNASTYELVFGELTGGVSLIDFGRTATGTGPVTPPANVGLAPIGSPLFAANGGDISFDINGTTVTLDAAADTDGVAGWSALEVRDAINAAAIAGITAAAAAGVVSIANAVVANTVIDNFVNMAPATLMEAVAADAGTGGGTAPGDVALAIPPAGLDGGGAGRWRGWTVAGRMSASSSMA